MARVKHGTLTAGVVATVTIDANCQMITVTCRSSGYSEIYFTVDGSTPAVGADDTYVASGARTVTAPLVTAPTTVRMVSSGTPGYSVAGETA
jgi:hypothetical protein